MSRNSELVKNTFWISVAQISAQVVNFLFIPLYTSVLSTAEYGMADLYATIRGVLMYILFLGLEQSIFRFCVSEKNKKKRQIYFSVNVIMASGLLIIYGILFWIGAAIWKFQYAQLLNVYYISYWLFVFIQQIARGMERMKLYAAATAFGTVFTVVSTFILVICLRYGVKGILAGSAIAYTTVDLYMLFRLSPREMFLFKWEKKAAMEMLRYSLPLALNNVMGWVTTSSDRLIITALLGNAANGIYALANKFYSILMILTHGFSMAWAETAIKVIRQPDHKEYYRKVICVSMDAYFMIISGMVAVTPFFFNYMVNKAYSEAYYHIPIIIYAAFWYAMAAVIGHVLLAHKKSGEVGTGTLLVAFMNLAVHFLLIGKIGLFAASVSTLVSYIGLFTARYLFMYRCEKIPFPWRRILLQFCVYLILCACYYRKGKAWLIMGVAVYLGSMIALVKGYRQELAALWTKIKENSGKYFGGKFYG